jgi:hypothetical protein
MRGSITIFVLFLLLAGCAGQWVKVSDDETYTTSLYRVSLPHGWVKRIEGDTLVLSKDGPDLQKIVVRAAEHKDAFRHIEKESAPDMLPSELSAMFIADLKKESGTGLPSLVVEVDEPAKMGGRDGFHIVAGYSTDAGVHYRLTAYGAVSERGFLTLSYTAPAIYYFDKDRGSFKHTYASLSLL